MTMKNRRVNLPVSVLHATLQTQVNESSKRVDVRRSENMMGNVYAQSSSLAQIDQEISATEESIKAASATLLDQADQKATKAVLFAYGEALR